jgi:hypothetical protein
MGACAREYLFCVCPCNRLPLFLFLQKYTRAHLFKLFCLYVTYCVYLCCVLRNHVCLISTSIEITATARSPRMSSWTRPMIFSSRIKRLPVRARRVRLPSASSSNAFHSILHCSSLAVLRAIVLALQIQVFAFNPAAMLYVCVLTEITHIHVRLTVMRGYVSIYRFS